MEYRNNNNLTPRDRIDDRFIRDLLDLEFDGGSDGGRTCTGDKRDSVTVGKVFEDKRERTDDCSVCGGNRVRKTGNCNSGRGRVRDCKAETRDGDRVKESQNGRCGRVDIKQGCSDRSGYGNYSENPSCADTDTDKGTDNSTTTDGYCGCGDCKDYSAPMLHGVHLAMVYSPYHEWGNLYEPEEGHSRGTIFKCLDFPFYPTSCNKNGCGCSDNDRKK